VSDAVSKCLQSKQIKYTTGKPAYIKVSDVSKRVQNTFDKGDFYMAGKQFYLTKRDNGTFYARLINPETKKMLTSRSTGQTDRDLAVLEVSNWLKNGLPATRIKQAQSLQQVFTVETLLHQVKTIDMSPQDAHRIMEALKGRGLLEQVRKTENRVFVDWLAEFYDYDKSAYVKEKLAHNQTIGKRHCNDSKGRVTKYYPAFFGSKKLSEITRQDFKEFGLHLTTKNIGLETVKKIIICGKVALSWAAKEGLITANPTDKLMQYTGEPVKRGILTHEEANKVLATTWKEERACVGNLVSATCGLRSGEVLALRIEDIEEDRLQVRHSYSTMDGLKSTKNGDQRQVPLLPYVKKALLDVYKSNPWQDGYIFYSAKQNQPMDHHFLIDGLYESLEKIGITEEERKSRNIVFHSWRHYYSATMSDLVDQRSLGLATGHKTPAMLEHYANHANEKHFQSVMEATKQAFSEVDHE